MERRKFSRKFKLEAVKLVRERGVAVAQAARDLDLHVNVLRKWVREQSGDPQQAFPGHGQMKPEQLEIEKLRREVAKTRVSIASSGSCARKACEHVPAGVGCPRMRDSATRSHPTSWTGRSWRRRPTRSG
jgi:transposase